MDLNTLQLSDAVGQELVNDKKPTMPLIFIDGLRMALESGMSCDEITACLVLFAGFHQMRSMSSGGSIIDRSLNVVRAIKKNIDRCS
jgi:hypothetical protein